MINKTTAEWYGFIRNLGQRGLIWAYVTRWAPLIAQLVKNPPAIKKTLIQFLGWEHPLEKG